MSRNLLKSNAVNMQGQEVRVINSNEILEEKLQLIREAIQQEEEERGQMPPSFEEVDFTQGLDADQVEALMGEQTETAQEGEEDTLQPLPVIKAHPIQAGPTREEVLQEAQGEIDAMMEKAAQEAENIRQRAREEGKAEGYREGYDTGYQEGIHQSDEIQQELKEKETRLERYYADKLEEIEPMFIDTLTGIYEHVFHVELDSFRPAIVSIITDVLGQSGSSKDFLIRVSSEDIEFVNKQKDQLQSYLAQNATMEFIEDKTLLAGDCLVETNSGIFDCGIDTQLQQLTKELKLLSYS